jgi:predicted O-linked N-acetylglucosamine transferase (SPINDLY family)
MRVPAPNPTPEQLAVAKADLLNRVALDALQQSRTERALELLQHSVRLWPAQPQAHLRIGAALMELRHWQEAFEPLARALELQPHFPEAHYNRGNALLALEQPAAALEAYDRALAQRPAYPEALDNRGTALHRLGRFDEALDSYRQALALRADFPPTLNNYANVLRDLGHLNEAIAYCDRALALRPRYPGALTNRGNALLRAGRVAEAIANFDEALALDPGFALAWQSKGLALHDHLGAAEPSLECFARAIAIGIETGQRYDFALGALSLARRCCADWQEDARLRADVPAAVLAGERAVTPFALLSITDAAAVQLRCARTHRAFENLGTLSESGPRAYGHARPRIGYMSGDFREHAVSYLVTGVLEQHDRGAFELYALSLRPADGSPYGTRIQAAVDGFIDLSALSDEQAAALIRSLEIDILIDLVGYTQGARSGILARRPAPIQVNYLGFPGTLAAPYIDYLIADEYLIPEEQQPHYSEQIVYLPECFQANDDRRFLPQSTPSRSSLSLPEQALVLCCFNNTYKINPTLFSLWMRLLHSVPESVLWLLADSHVVERNLRAQAAERGIDPARLLFAPRVPYEQHLARLAAADLFLDTLPFNGGTTISDALWVGLPVLSCSGEALAARMGGSLLRAVGLSELIVPDLAHYEQLALELLSAPERLASLRERLIAQRSASPLFNTARFTRDLEQAFRSMHDAFGKGLPPAPIYVPRHA